MRIAVISDIHSNIYALDKVIEDIKSKNVDMVVCTGDFLLLKVNIASLGRFLKYFLFSSVVS